MEQSPRVSAVVCTYNRDKYLEKALMSLVEQSADTGEYEVILVDNASTDGTADIAAKFRSLPHFRYIYETKKGLSNARNAGIAAARADIVAFLDDDAVACNDWIGQIVKAFEDPKAGAVGGQVDPIWESEPPSWVTAEIALYFSVVDWGERQYLPESKWIVGANMAFRKELLERFGGFNDRLGRKGKKLISGEETLLIRQVRDAGYEVLYVPEMHAQHLVPSGRMSRKWLKERAWWGGFSARLVDRMLGETPPAPLSLRDKFWFLRRYLFATSFAQKLNIMYTLGFHKKIDDELAAMIEQESTLANP